MDDEKETEAPILKRDFIWRIPDCCKDVMEGKRDYCDHTTKPKERKKKQIAL